jgi:succinate dehydrogenase/fumarate reductase cytochrome b subunit
LLEAEKTMLVKIIIVIVLLVIIASLGVALRHLLMDGERSPATVKALTFRIGLSIALFLLLLLGYAMGLLRPHGLQGGLATQLSGERK